MRQQQLTLHDFQLGYIKMIAADLDEVDMAVAPFPGDNPPVWILGQLAVCTDYAGRMLGLKPECPREWHKHFAPGTNPAEVPQPHPSKEELLTAIDKGHRRVAEAFPNANWEALEQPHAVELLKRSNLKTNADVLAHLMTTHPAFHVAQLSACRRKKGKGPVV
jgi:hypothetical protein